MDTIVVIGGCGKLQFLHNIYLAPARPSWYIGRYIGHYWIRGDIILGYYWIRGDIILGYYWIRGDIILGHYWIRGDIILGYYWIRGDMR